MVTQATSVRWQLWIVAFGFLCRRWIPPSSIPPCPPSQPVWAKSVTDAIGDCLVCPDRRGDVARQWLAGGPDRRQVGVLLSDYSVHLRIADVRAISNTE